MAFEVSEKNSTSSPIELYRFVGTDNTYLLTSYHKDITVAGDIYLSTAIERDEVRIGTHENDDLRLTVSMPVNHPMVSEYMFNIGPPDLKLHLYRCHSSDLTDHITYWTGDVMSFAIDGRVAKMLIPSMFSYFLNGLLPAPRYQGPCNHVLFDQFCKLPRVDNEFFTTITHIDDNNITVASSPYVDGRCIAGEMVLIGRNQRRMIIDNIGSAFKISYPFMQPQVGDDVSFTIGCDHTFTTCKELLNGKNYGGFPYIPDRNPFKGRI